jgi:hypothetical protein
MPFAVQAGGASALLGRGDEGNETRLEPLVGLGLQFLQSLFNTVDQVKQSPNVGHIEEIDAGGLLRSQSREPMDVVAVLAGSVHDPHS